MRVIANLILFLIVANSSYIFSQPEPYIIDGEYVWVPGYEFNYDWGDTLLFPGNQLVKIYKSFDSKKNDYEKLIFDNRKVVIKYSYSKILPGKAIIQLDTTFKIYPEIESDFDFNPDDFENYHVSAGDTVGYVGYVGEGLNLIRVGNHIMQVDFSTMFENPEMIIINSNKQLQNMLHIEEINGWINTNDYKTNLIRRYDAKEW